MTTRALLDFRDAYRKVQLCGLQLRVLHGLTVTRNQLTMGTTSSLLQIVDVRVQQGVYLTLEAHQLALGSFGVRGIEYILGDSTVQRTWQIDGGENYMKPDPDAALCIRCLQDCDGETCPATAPHDAVELSRLTVTLRNWVVGQLL